MKRIKSSKCSCSANFQSKYNKNLLWPTKKRTHQRKSRHTYCASINTSSMQRRLRQFNHLTQSPPLFQRTMQQPSQQRRRKHNQLNENDSRDNASNAERQVTAKRNVAPANATKQMASRKKMQIRGRKQQTQTNRSTNPSWFVRFVATQASQQETADDAFPRKVALHMARSLMPQIHKTTIRLEDRTENGNNDQ